MTPTQIERAAKEAHAVLMKLSTAELRRACDAAEIRIDIFTCRTMPILTAELSAQPSANLQPAASVAAQGDNISTITRLESLKVAHSAVIAERDALRADVAALRAEVVRLTKERDEARQYGERLYYQYSQATGKVVTCAFCGHQYADGTPTSQHERLTAHVLVCEKHPLRAIEAERDTLRQRIAELEAAREVTLPQAFAMMDDGEITWVLDRDRVIASLTAAGIRIKETK